MSNEKTHIAIRWYSDENSLIVSKGSLEECQAFCDKVETLYHDNGYYLTIEPLRNINF